MWIADSTYKTTYLSRRNLGYESANHFLTSLSILPGRVTISDAFARRYDPLAARSSIGWMVVTVIMLRVYGFARKLPSITIHQLRRCADADDHISLQVSRV